MNARRAQKARAAFDRLRFPARKTRIARCGGSRVEGGGGGGARNHVAPIDSTGRTVAHLRPISPQRQRAGPGPSPLG